MPPRIPKLTAEMERQLAERAAEQRLAVNEAKERAVLAARRLTTGDSGLASRVLAEAEMAIIRRHVMREMGGREYWAAVEREVRS